MHQNNTLMKSPLARLLIALTVGFLTSAISPAAELGIAAPPLKIAQWVKGSPVDLATGKDRSVFVIEFWATWCGPCLDSIPHLTELQKKFKDRGLVIIGVTDEKPEEVKPFVEKMGAKMGYAVAIDQAKQTSRGYMDAFGVGGIPHAFIVDQAGRVVWHGHPMAGLDKAVEQVLAHFSHSDWLSRLSDGRRVGVLAAALSACGLKQNRLAVL